MTKKEYIAPNMEVLKIGTLMPLAISGVISDDEDIDIYFGGVDEEGIIGCGGTTCTVTNVLINEY